MGERLGFIGLGNMGKPMAVNLARAGRRSGGAWSESGRFGGQRGGSPLDFTDFAINRARPQK